MILIWRGMGLLVLLFLFGGMGLGMLIAHLTGARDETFSVGIGLLIGAAICTAVGARLMKRQAEGERHDLYFIPVVLWGPVLGIGGLVMLLNGIGTGGPSSYNSTSQADASPMTDQDAAKILGSIFTRRGDANGNDQPGVPDATPAGAAASAGAPPAVEDGFVLRPMFELEDDEVMAGSAFAVKVSGDSRVLILSALHLLGPSGGLDADIPASQVPSAVKGLALMDAFTEEMAHEGAVTALSIPDAAPLGTKSASGDIIAFLVEPNPKLSPRKLAMRPAKRGDRVYLVARLVHGGASQTRLHPATVMGKDAYGDLIYNFDSSNIQLRATSGAPVINTAGEVVAINLGGFTIEVNGRSTGRVSGSGNPVERFRQMLSTAIRRAPKPERLVTAPRVGDVDGPVADARRGPRRSGPTTAAPNEAQPAPGQTVIPLTPPDAKPPEAAPPAAAPPGAAPPAAGGPGAAPAPAPSPVPPPPQAESPRRIDPPSAKSPPAKAPSADAPRTRPAPPTPRSPRTAPRSPRTAPRPPTPAAPRPPSIEREPTLSAAQFKARVLGSRLTSAAFHNDDNFPASFDAVKPFSLREDDRKDPWGDEFLYFGAGRKRDIRDRSKTLLIATAKPHDGKRVVAYLSGDVETVTEAEYQKLKK